MFKSAYVRGIQSALIQSGHVAFPDADSAAKVADYVADHVSIDPIDAGVTREDTLKVANALIEASNYIASQPGFKAAAFNKVASVEDLTKVAHIHVMDLMQKAAEGSTIEGGDKGNDKANSAEGKMDESARPAGYATNSLGSTAVDTKPGAVGSESDQPAAPSNSPSGSNSVTEARTASLANLIKKVAEGSTILGGDKGNSEPNSAEGKMDMAARPAGYAVLPSQGGLGAMMALVSGSAVVGKEMAHPNGPGESPSGSNSVTQHSAKAAAVDPYIELFKKTAAEIVTLLPGGMSDDSKIAHTRACMGMTMEEKAHYLVGLQKEAADKTASTASAQKYQGYNGKQANQKAAEMPPFIQAKIDAKKDDGDKDEDDKKDSGNPFAKKDDEKSEKKDDEKSEKKDEEEKAASLRAHFNRISASVRA